MRFLDLLEAQLADALRQPAEKHEGFVDLLEGQLADALHQPAEHQVVGRIRVRQRLRALAFGRARGKTLIALVTVTVASGALADASGVFGPDRNLSTPSPLGTARSIPPALASSFAVMRRAPQPGDALPAGTALGAVAGGLGPHYGINPSLSRFVGTINGTSFWLVAGSTGACLYTSNLGSICARDDYATTVGLDGNVGRDLGILPDGASITATKPDGSTAPIARSGAAYEVLGNANLATATIHENDGNELTLPGPASLGAGPSGRSGPTRQEPQRQKR
jgi:hypothetical protein